MSPDCGPKRKESTRGFLWGSICSEEGLDDLVLQVLLIIEAL
jgi:hypothetical protein